MSVKKYIVLNKLVGETPLSILEKFKKGNPEITHKKLAYAGRLDPMANGKLLVLIGNECKKQNKYISLDKEYRFEVLLNFSSDTGDVLGIANYNKNNPQKSFNKIAKNLIGKISIPFPIFSSKTVSGKPLFLWALEDKINEIEIPIKHSTIYKLSYEKTKLLSKEKLKKNIFEKINSIPKVTEKSKELGRDFRREEIRERWNNLFNKILQKEFKIITFSCSASSGTYMRTLSSIIGKELGTSGLAYSIERTKIGRYLKIVRSVGFWYKNYK